MNNIVKEHQLGFIEIISEGIKISSSKIKEISLIVLGSFISFLFVYFSCLDSELKTLKLLE